MFFRRLSNAPANRPPFIFPLAADAAGEHAALYRQRSLPHRPVIPLVARMADQNTSGTPAMTEREASRLDKFKQLLAGPNTDLGKTHLRFPVFFIYFFNVLGHEFPFLCTRLALSCSRSRSLPPPAVLHF